MSLVRDNHRPESKLRRVDMFCILGCTMRNEKVVHVLEKDSGFEVQNYETGSKDLAEKVRTVPNALG